MADTRVHQHPARPGCSSRAWGEGCSVGGGGDRSLPPPGDAHAPQQQCGARAAAGLPHLPPAAPPRSHRTPNRSPRPAATQPRPLPPSQGGDGRRGPLPAQLAGSPLPPSRIRHNDRARPATCEPADSRARRRIGAVLPRWSQPSAPLPVERALHRHRRCFRHPEGDAN